MSTSSHSPYSTLLATVLASSVLDVRRGIRSQAEEDIDSIAELAVAFLSSPVSPVAVFDFEVALNALVRELGRKVLEFACNRCEPEACDEVPHDVVHEARGYRRRNEKTPNKYVETTFGRITVRRRGYRYWHRGEKQASIFPLELILGLTENATPALAGEISRMMGDSGATQNRTREQAKRHFQLSLSVERLRDITAGVAEAMERFREHYQVRKLLQLLRIAEDSRGRYRPVLCVGRDGITMPMAKGGYRQAAVATVAVYDRRGGRLGTVFLASIPESEQLTLTKQLTILLKACLADWCKEGGRLPRLCYVTDAGDNESNYFNKTLCRMRDPRDSSRYLRWTRIFDYFHVTEKITTMAEAIFGPGTKASSWARKMRKLLLKPNGPSRVLHSAAAHRATGILGDRKKFTTAYDYIRTRTRYMNYAEFRRLRLPIGSGVTEAACKTVFTQRLKLSGMGWTPEGAQTVLRLRTMLLSGIWDEAYRAALEHQNPVELRPYQKHRCEGEKIAA